MKNLMLRFQSVFFFIIIITIFSNSCKKEIKESVDLKSVYDEKYRPQFHYSPPAGWMNDPNGLVYYAGDYHLFYQHYPDSNVWGPMHWGHAVSSDLVHWSNLPIALYPDSLGYIFSGSVVVDEHNTSGLGSETAPPLVAIFTYHDQQAESNKRNDFQKQGLAYSIDKGRTWTKFDRNPVIANPGVRDFRDPKVTWHEPSNQWIVTLAVLDHVEFYGSENLIAWTKLGGFGKNIGSHEGVWECPDLFVLEDEMGNSKWVLLLSINPGAPLGGSATQYFIGEFDGQQFTPQDTLTRWVDYGADNYAGVTWANAPNEKGTRAFIGWMSNWDYAEVVPTQQWRSAMTIPRTLSLISRDDMYVLKSKPAPIIDILQKATASYSNDVSLKDSLYVMDFDITGDVHAFSLSLSNSMGEQVTIEASNDSLLFDRSKSGIVSFQNSFAKKYRVAFPTAAIKNVKVYVDVASIELFINDGERVLTNIVFPTMPYNHVHLEGASATFSVTTLRSIWEKKGSL